MRLSTLLAIGLATTFTAGATVNPTAQQTASKSMIEHIMRTNAEAGNGNWVPTLEIVKNAEGVPTSKIERKFDDKAQLIEAKHYNIYNGDEESAYPYLVYTYAYDEAGRTTLDQAVYYWNGPETPSSGDKNEYAYDANGNKTKYYKYYLSSDGEWVKYDYYDYAWDSQGRQTLYQNIWTLNADGKYEDGSKKEYAYDAEGMRTTIIYAWDVEAQEFNPTQKTEWLNANGKYIDNKYAYVDEEFKLTSSYETIKNANGFQTLYQYLSNNNGYRTETEYDSQNRQTSCANYEWNGEEFVPSNKTETQYSEEFSTYIDYTGDGEKWMPIGKRVSPTKGWGQATYAWDSEKKDWYLWDNYMTIQNNNGQEITNYSLGITGEIVDGVRQYSGTKTEYSYGSDSGEMETVYEWDNETQDWGKIIKMSPKWGSGRFELDSRSTTGLFEEGSVYNNGQDGWKNTSYYRTGSILWTAYYTWDAEKQEFVETSKLEYKYTLDENGNVATREAYLNGELYETVYYFYTEVGTTGIDGVTAATGAFKVSGNTITFAEATNVAVYTLDGKMVHNGVTNTLTLDAGNVYILKGEGWNKKIAL